MVENFGHWSSMRLLFVAFSFHILFTSSFHNTLLHAHSTTGTVQTHHPAYPSLSPTTPPVSQTKLNGVELRVQIQGTKNAYTMIRSGDVVSFKTVNPTKNGKSLRLGVLSESGDILPLAVVEEDAAEFKVDPSSPPIKAEQLKKEGRIGRMYSSDRKGDTFLIDEFIDSDIYLPILSELTSQFNLDATDIDLLEKQLEIARLEAKILEAKRDRSNYQKGKTVALLSPNAPQPIGPYSQAVILNDQVYVSGCIGIDPKTGKLVDGGIEEQTLQSLSNLQAILVAANSDTNRIAKTTIYVTDLGQYAIVNKLYAAFLQKSGHDSDIVLPARTTVQVSALPLGALVEIDAIAGISSS